MIKNKFIILTLLFMISWTKTLFGADNIIIPEGSSEIIEKRGTVASNFIVTTANPYATNVGYDIIRRGGNALDAAIASQLILNLVEPQSSGIGGGAFIMFWDNKNKILHSYDGRETAPDSANPYLFIDEKGEIIRRSSAIIGGKSVGVPGLIRVLELAHNKHGKMQWSELFKPAINLSSKGFKLSPRLFKLLKNNKILPRLKDSSSYFYQPDGQPFPIGTTIINKPFAKTLSKISKHGSKEFYIGSLAKEIVEKVKTSAVNPGLISIDDLKSYQAISRKPICGKYFKYTVCGPPPPSSGGIGVIQMLGILENFNLNRTDPWSLEALKVFIEATRLMFADRELYIADPDFFLTPAKQLVSREYLQKRAKLIQNDSILKDVSPGKFRGYPLKSLSKGNSLELQSTTHISIIDNEGNAVSMTSSIEAAFGSHLMVRGFFLNNQLTDFSYKPIKEGKIVANQVESGKRPRSSMAPIIILDESNEVIALTGSAGGPSIIPLVTKSIIGLLDWSLSPQDAINLPNVLSFGSTVFLEKGTNLEKKKAKLLEMGYKVRSINFASGLHAIYKKDGKLFGGADPRREGKVRGD
ncbi:MAG: gamma-glutamyltransferase [Alphaproteobacteria bacterium TMED87]|nr:gamma-glutamyltransferase [Rhodospirillaceae bacterium]OUV10525.1 MAG: gamma-glutamyltransferase [Alphaproteobacteria bacterium TMED87]